MNLNQIKQDAREEFKIVRDNLKTYDTSLHQYVIDDEQVLALVDMLLDRLVDEIEKAVVPQDPELAVKAEHIRKNFTRFKGESV